jgi:hypothetical protein
LALLSGLLITLSLTVHTPAMAGHKETNRGAYAGVVTLRDKVEKTMTAAQISEATGLAARFIANPIAVLPPS